MFVGALAPVISLSQLTPTSVRVSWTQPENSFTVLNYQVVLVRVTQCDSFPSQRGPRPQDNANDMTELFEDLGEYITYRAGVTVTFQSPSSSFTVDPVEAEEMEFTTPGIGTVVFLLTKIYWYYLQPPLEFLAMWCPLCPPELSVCPGML